MATIINNGTGWEGGSFGDIYYKTIYAVYAPQYLHSMVVNKTVVGTILVYDGTASTLVASTTNPVVGTVFKFNMTTKSSGLYVTSGDMSAGDVTITYG